MTTSRRQMLGSLFYGATAGALGLGCARGAAPRAPRPSARSAGPKVVRVEAGPARAPHYFVSLLLLGGYDSVLTFDSKDQDHVGAKIDCGYRSADRVHGRERLYGPLIGKLLKHESDMCIVHGVRLDTVSHAEGFYMAHSGRRQARAGDDFPTAFPAMIATDARHRPLVVTGTPGASGVGFTIDPYTARSLFEPERPTYGRPPLYEEIEAAQIAQGRALLRDFPDQAQAYERLVKASGGAHDWLEGTPRSTSMVDTRLGPSLALVFDSIKHDFARFHEVVLPELWLDSHTDNDAIQRRRLTPLFSDIATFIDLLKTERNAFGTLFEQTTLVIGTEMGRYPKLNSTAGKDHWPENSWVMLGKGVRAGATVGRTADTLRGMPTDHTTGRVDAGDLRPIYVDAVYATIARIFGANLSALGYREADVLSAALA